MLCVSIFSMTSVQDWGWDFQDRITNLYLYSGGGGCHCCGHVVHHVHPLHQSHPLVLATTTQKLLKLLSQKGAERQTQMKS